MSERKRTVQKSIDEIEHAIKKELVRLQNIFKVGYELTVKYTPNGVRYSQHGKLLLNEVNSNVILIYEDSKEKAIATLYHEFMEWMISPLIKSYLDVINGQNKIIITQLLCNKKEDVVDKLIKSL
jgi:hypothetical protein